MFNIGGHGAMWGLFCPHIHNKPLAAKSRPNLSKEILNTWYIEAKTLMGLSLLMTNTIHQSSH